MMRVQRRVVLIVAFLLTAGNGFCQTEQKELSMQTYGKVGLGINGFGFSVETPLNQKITLEAAVGVGPSYDIHNGESVTESMGWSWALLEPSIYTSVYGKFYYNRKSRLTKGKSLEPNTGMFIGLKAKYVSQSLSYPAYYANTLLTNLNWGGQYRIDNHWVYGFSIGLGYGYNLDSSYGMFYPAMDLSIAYVFSF